MKGRKREWRKEMLRREDDGEDKGEEEEREVGERKSLRREARSRGDPMCMGNCASLTSDGGAAICDASTAGAEAPVNDYASTNTQLHHCQRPTTNDTMSRNDVGESGRQEGTRGEPNWKN